MADEQGNVDGANSAQATARRAAARIRQREQNPEAAAAERARATRLRAASRARQRHNNPEAAAAANARATQLRAAARALQRQENPANIAAQNARASQRRAEMRTQRREHDPEGAAAANAYAAQRRAEERAQERELHPAAAAASNAYATQLRAVARAEQREQDPAAATAIQQQNTVQHAAARSRERAMDLEGPDSVPRTHRCAIGYGILNSAITHSLGTMDVVCSFCGARHFSQETAGVRKSFNTCCEKGKVVLPPLAPMPLELKQLFPPDVPPTTNPDIESVARRTSFLKQIRSYNGAMAFASVVCKTEVFHGRGPQSYKIQGQMYHYIAPLHPLPHHAPSFGQLYFVDTEEAVSHQRNLSTRGNNDGHLRADVLRILQETIRRVNPYARQYMHVAEIEAACEREGHPVSELAIVFGQASEPRIRNMGRPLSGEVAALINDDGRSEPHEVVVHLRHREDIQEQVGTYRGLECIASINPNVDPLCYPLLFPNGDRGWHPGIPKHGGGRRGTVSMRAFYSYRLSDRGDFNAILRSGKLMQQYVVDAWVKIEKSVLDFQRRNQAALRAETYRGLADYLANAAHRQDVDPGRVVVLASSFIGGPRYMNEAYHDAMAICRRFGRPDLFVTFTCNPKWAEVTSQLLPGQSATDRPDLLATVFKLKLDELLNDILKRQILGTVVAYTWVIEFQKRGLPHCHMLLILAQNDKPLAADDIDNVAIAEVPSIQVHNDLHQKVLRFMVHGPCGIDNLRAPCMEERNGERVCTRGFPKAFADTTSIGDKSYPIYRRRGINVGDKHGRSVDDRWIVPYNPYLLTKFNGHINVEVCATIKSIKYLYKYIYKGHDQAIVEIRRRNDAGALVPQLDHDEILTYVNSRYVSASEAIWRIREYPMQCKSHSVTRLAVHLEGEQQLIFRAGEEDQAIASAQRHTTLTAWFQLNRDDPDARGIVYHKIPEQYHFVTQGQRFWKKRGRVEKVIGRIYSVNPAEVERYCLRLLLLYTPGATSYHDLRTIEGEVFATFREACVARELIERDDEWARCMVEAAEWQMPYQLRQLFCTLLLWCNVSQPQHLYDIAIESMGEDYVRHLSNTLPNRDMPTGLMREVASHLASVDIRHLLQRRAQKTLADFGIEASDLATNLEANDILQDYLRLRPPHHNIDNELAPENNRDQPEQLQADIDALNTEQRAIFDEVSAAVINPRADRYFFVDGPGGTGKTHLYNVIVRSLKRITKHVICVAWTGIAAMLLPGGTTVHSRFKLPIVFDNNTTLGVRGQTEEASEIRTADVIIWDEAPMAPATALDIIDAGIREICKDSRPFGGKVLLLGGDFRQVLPVVQRGTRANQVAAAIWNASSWRHIKTLRLHRNMRTNANQQEFARWLLDIGNGITPERVQLPEGCIVQGDLVDEVYGQQIDPDDIERLRSSVILAPRNNACAIINERANEKLPGSAMICRSIDRMPENAENRDLFPVEFINTLTPSGMPPHILHIKVGSVVMLLRNLNIKRGLCNGVRMIVKSMRPHTLHVELLTGERAGTTAFIPRIKLIPALSQTPFEFIRTQFPVQLAFAMTINKAQGQTFGCVGLSLLQPVFSHGQLYVALSRVRSKESLKVKLTEGHHTKNVVYQEALQAQLCTSQTRVRTLRIPIGIPATDVHYEEEDDPIGHLEVDQDINDFDDT